MVPTGIHVKYTLNVGSTPASDCFCVRFSADSRYLAASFANGAISIFDIETGIQKKMFNATDAQLPTTQLRWRPHSSSYLTSVSAEQDGRIMHWDIESGECLHTITEPKNPLFCIDYSKNGSHFAAAGKDHLVRVYDEATNQPVQTLQGGDIKHPTGHSNRVYSLTYHPVDPNTLLSGGWDNTVQVWDLRRGHSVRSLWAGQSVDFSSDGKKLVTG
eukprot:CAMPEP_0179337208 /NCGR_PEP_ID=MMETSP0797-20121207/67493_1 /TAXON_ID=47934 /ORGANISM="Dinophysis acuminata, Strain DAEP01" /LENGTH=215 /DNA_ID=CAMNT_0021050825 /DNA_START=1 /DNA_END=644 /DNA_ORIENTATION=+